MTRISTWIFAQPYPAKSLFPLAFLMAFAAVLGPAANIAQAQKRKKPTAPIVTDSLTAPIVAVTQIRPDVAELTITNIQSTIGTRQEYQVINGPNAAGSPASITIGNVIRVGLRNTLGQYPIQLLPNSDYVVRVRNIKTSAEFSNWVNVSLRTADNFSTRPSAPPNLRITQQTATQVTLMWDAPDGVQQLDYPFTYELFLNGVRTSIFQCGGPYVQCTEADFRTVTINRPNAGTTLTFGVTARDSNLNRSELSTITLD